MEIALEGRGPPGGNELGSERARDAGMPISPGSPGRIRRPACAPDSAPMTGAAANPRQHLGDVLDDAAQAFGCAEVGVDLRADLAGSVAFPADSVSRSCAWCSSTSALRRLLRTCVRSSAVAVAVSSTWASRAQTSADFCWAA